MALHGTCALIVNKGVYMNGLAEFIFTCRVPHVTIVTEKRFSFNHIPGYLVRLSLKNVTNAKLKFPFFWCLLFTTGLAFGPPGSELNYQIARRYGPWTIRPPADTAHCGDRRRNETATPATFTEVPTRAPPPSHRGAWLA